MDGSWKISFIGHECAGDAPLSSGVIEMAKTALDQAKALLPRLTYAEAHDLRLAIVDMFNRADRVNGVFAEELEDLHEGPAWQAAMASKEPIEAA